MAIPNRQIGWSQESNLLWEITRQMDKLTKVVSTTGGGGGGGYTIVNVTSTTHTATETSGTVILLVDATTAGGNVTINLPTAVGNTAQFIINKIDSGVNTVTIDGSGSETINGALTQVIYTQYVSLSVVSNNANWFII
jgi:hypothetical protein